MLRLVCANLNYSSWSIRPWLALRQARAEFKIHDVGLKTTPDYKDKILSFSGAGKVPVLIDGSLSVHESLAICEYVAELYPTARLWPEDVKLRARGRAISCEMLSSFSHLRNAMTTNLRGRAVKTPSGPEIERDIARVFDVWQASLASSGGPFLLGDFSIADCMYYPVATRFRTYGVALPDHAVRYSQSLFERPHHLELEAIAKDTPPIAEYEAKLGR